MYCNLTKHGITGVVKNTLTCRITVHWATASFAMFMRLCYNLLLFHLPTQCLVFHTEIVYNFHRQELVEIFNVLEVGGWRTSPPK